MLRVQSSSSEASCQMTKVGQKGIGAEIVLRRELYSIGLRYRVDFEVLNKHRFSGADDSHFVDGCFWHGYPKNATWPKQNSDF